MVEIVTGIVVRERNYKETSKIIDVLTKEYGKISVIAKGCRTLKSELRTTTCKLSYGKFYIYYKKDKLSTLKSVDTINNFKNILTNIEKISYAAYLLDLATQVASQKQDSKIFDLLISSLNKINEGYDPLSITNILELQYLTFLGVEPTFDYCGKCKSKTDIVTLSINVGGYVCKNCYTNEKIYSQEAIKLIRGLKYVDIDKINKIDIKDAIKKEINDFLDDYYEKYTGLYLQSKEFLKNISKVGK
jgi:DNA repair protein RecO (recombination protein O)